MKRFRNFENVSHKEYDFIHIECGCVYKSSSKTVYKGSRIESIEDSKKLYKNFLEEYWRKKNCSKRYFKNQLK